MSVTRVKVFVLMEPVETFVVRIVFAVRLLAVSVFAYIELAVPVKNWAWPVERDETANVPAIRVPTVAFITLIELVASDPEAKEEVVI